MPRSRSRSRSPIDRRRRSRSRERRRRRDRSRERSRRDKEGRRSHSRDRDYNSAGIPSGSGHKDKTWDREREKRKVEKEASLYTAPAAARLTDKDFEGKSQEEIDMMKVMGFGGFQSTKGKKVKGNDVGDVHVVVKRKYRQYMNRKGGFNRPLDFVH